MSEAMELSERALEQIGGYVKRNLSDWMREVDVPIQRVDPHLLERVVRVEDELRLQRELMKQGFEQVERRFEQVEKRFVLVDKQLDNQRAEMIGRFDQVDKRFEEAGRHLTHSMAVMMLVLAAVGVAGTILGIVFG